MNQEQIAAKANELLSRMTLPEKVAQIMQLSYAHMSEEERLMWMDRGIGSLLHVMGSDAQRFQDMTLETKHQIPLIFGIDCVRGHAMNPAATVFPCQLGMAAAFNPEMVQKAGEISAIEVTEDALHMVFSPVLCLGRDTRWGRVDETFGEDPYLSGELAAAMVKGYQGDGEMRQDTGVIACAKHYLAHGESTGGRDSYDVPITNRKVLDTFAPPFKKVIDAGCKSIMTAYHTLDGVPCTANKWLLDDLLRDIMGFEGFVITDWDNTGRLMWQQFYSPDMRHAAKSAIEAGNDMIMSTPGFYDAAISMVESGELKESRIDEAVLRVLKVKLEMGLFGEKRTQFNNKKESKMACDEHLKVNSDFTNQTVVMLENKNNILPLPNNMKKIAVVGPNANNISSQYGDWTFYTHPLPDFTRKPESVNITVWDGISGIAKKNNIDAVLTEWDGPVSVYRRWHAADENDIQSQFRAGDGKSDADAQPEVPCFEKILKNCEGADVVVAVVGDDPTLNGEERDRANLDLPYAQQKMLEVIKEAGHKLIVVGISGKPLTVRWAKENADAMLWAFCPGMYGGSAIAGVLFGDINPSGRLPITFPQIAGQVPVYYNQLPGWHGGKYIDLPTEPLYTFGYGLSYSEFEFSNLKCSDKISADSKEDISITIDVTNKGKKDGTSVVQLYFRDMYSSIISTPVKQFKGSERVCLKAGETKNISFKLPMDELVIIDHDYNRIIEKGLFKLFVGDGLYLEKEFEIV
ncbi:MAG: glycoside hydrolase family 3 C-terminal domain-containing protein [Oscillospiraceae bacterium]|nr:glycoside hydrolase family 3 C-terminal domain-containing protein [Oscillospiraceae bacterium]